MKHKISICPSVRHLAIVMDGNRRWAKNHGLPSSEGHQKGYQKFKEVCRWCRERNIPILTVYCFSTENWKRSPREVRYLMRLFEMAFVKELRTFHQHQIQVRVIGKKEGLPPSLLAKIQRVEKETSPYQQHRLNLALNYGGRMEIVEAVQKMLKHKLRPEEITPQLLEKYLYTYDLPDPDLIIRTSGEQRTSNFLIWQSAYSEWYFSEQLWPDFSEDELDKALLSMESRQRRYGH
ncbi:MAG: di-trans,poly-cis-decaprenylcistransferase [Planctomycetota bacterium]|nr:MAG: di-trans,poly-cis-decaprenylcistransferase [Planctomycetota bacterium]